MNNQAALQLPFSLQPLFDFVGQVTGGSANAFIILVAALKILLILGGLLQTIPFIILLERKIIGWIQDRPGPNRAGPLGILHGLLDGVKLFFKEEIMPKGVDKVLFLMAPSLVVVPAFLALCLVPVGPIIQGRNLAALANFLRLDPTMVGPGGVISQIPMAITNPNIGILYVLAITSMGVYGITLAGWSSNNKWSLLGGIRASAQMVSYEITLSLAILSVILLSGSLNLYQIIETQRGGFWNWHILAAPVAFILFVVAMFAETNRLPFDLAEAEAELTGGFHTEYSSMRFALFFLGEYVNMVIVAGMCVTLFLGGFYGPIQIETIPLTALQGGWDGLASQFSQIPSIIITLASYLLGPLVIFPAKVSFFIFLFIFARAILPRMRYDQLMSLGWKRLLPIGLINLVITAIAVAGDLAYRASLPGGLDANPHIFLATKLILGAVTLGLFLGWDALIFSPARKKQLTTEYRNLERGADHPAQALAQ
ncbi:NADH-quinone oxidoreductase subunit NuoH [Candidatus Sumerlaeota bacterium]|nr:NADH-quinone oxidoreductase subunit NuoH [Candidatus Sumerlaeota bacterium]